LRKTREDIFRNCTAQEEKKENIHKKESNISRKNLIQVIEENSK